MAGQERFDIVIAGGGVMGASAAYWLTRTPGFAGRVAVIERDPGHARSSTALSVASIRLQFSNAVNVQISRFGMEFIENAHDYIGLEGDVQSLDLQANGYLFLAGTAEQAATMRENRAVQVRHGARTELLQPSEVSARFPFLDCHDVMLGAFGPGEGWFDNMGLLNGLRRAAQARGAIFLADEVIGLDRADGRVSAARLASGARLSCGWLVNAAGTRARSLARMAGLDIPVEPRKRTVFLIDAPNVQARSAPLLVDHTGFYLRPEGKHWLCATVPEHDPPVDVDDFEPRHEEFEASIWPRLFARAPGFDAVKVLRFWAGHYAFNRLDANAIVGPHPDVANFIFCNGFSGHGLQQAPAMGRAVAEWIVTGGYRSLDLSPLGVERVIEGRPFLEKAVV